MFRIPWLVDVSDSWACGGYLRERPQPVNRTLLLIDLILEGLDSEARERCGIPKDLLFDAHWFSAYFTTAQGGYFFESYGADCAEKGYTLSSSGKTPTDLPMADDPTLQRIIGEAIDIVASIHYKRCPPARFPSSN